MNGKQTAEYIATRDEMVKELRAELSECQAAYWNKTAKLEDQLAAAEALCQQYREALEYINETNLKPSVCVKIARLLASPSISTTALNNAIAEELEQVAEGYMVYDPIDSTKLMQYYGSYIRGVLRNRAKELREEKLPSSPGDMD